VSVIEQYGMVYLLPPPVPPPPIVMERHWFWGLRQTAESCEACLRWEGAIQEYRRIMAHYKEKMAAT
jgi:hypothetical protein